MTTIKTFRDLGTEADTADALAAVGIVAPFPVQEMTIPLALAGNDVIAQAPTGTGKTLAYAVPVLQRITVPGPGLPEALVVVPTRELALQVAGDLETASGDRGVRILMVYGGRSYDPQIEGLKAGVEIVVGTPGRLLDLANRRVLDLSAVRALVLDEADRMLDLGFLPDVERIISLTPDSRQTLLFSATMPGEVVGLSRRYLRQATQVHVEHQQGATGLEEAQVPEIRQLVYRTHQLDKGEVLARILQAKERGRSMVFCRTRVAADMVGNDLVARGFKAAAVHGDLGQGDRERAMRDFRSNTIEILVATDVAARGLDVESVTHIINYDCPEDEKAYLHRVGRSARAGATGTAITFLDWADLPRWKSIDNLLGLELGEPPETYSTSPHLYSDLDIPDDAVSVFPGAPGPEAARAARRAERDASGRSGRPGGRRDGGRGRPRPRDGDVDRDDRKPGRSRERRRTRSGQQTDPSTSTPTEGSAGRDGGGQGSEPQSTGGDAPRRRRRRRTQRSNGQDSSGNVEG